MTEDGGRRRQAAGLVLARGGSVRVPRKNVRVVCGQPLIAWVLQPMLDCKNLTSVWVSTEDAEIAEVSLRLGAQVHARDEGTAGDASPSVAGVRDFLDKHPEVGVVALVQCTSPCLLPMYLDEACQRVMEDECDSVHSVYRQKKLRWKEVGRPGESTRALNFDPQRRPRGQEWPGELVESGHFYVCRAEVVKETDSLHGKRCGYVELPPELCCCEVDTETDLIVAEKLLELYGYRNSRLSREHYV